MPLWKQILFGLLCVFGLALLGGAGFAWYQVDAYGRSMARVYAVQSPQLKADSDPEVIARGQHLAESIGGCIDCHAADLGGKLMVDMGPVGIVHAPNITSGGVGAGYTDAEFTRVLRDGIKRDGTSLMFMPSGDFRWWPEADLVALLSWWRAQPAVKRKNPPSHIGVLGKVLDRLDLIPIDIARRIDHSRPPELAPAPAPTAAYGKFIAKLCEGCHGPTLSGGPIPGAPPDIAVPSNITQHATGIAGWSEADFYKALSEGVRPDGRKLDPMMPVTTLKAMNDTEKKALWLFIRSVPGKAFGGR